MTRWMELSGVGGVAEGTQDHGRSSFRDLEGGVDLVADPLSWS